MKKVMLSVFIVAFMALSLWAGYPVCKEATLVEQTSSTEVMVQASGMYKSPESKVSKAQKDVEKNGVTLALEDGRKSAVYFVLFGGTDPILAKADEKQKFEASIEDFLSNANVVKYISWESPKMDKSLSVDNGTARKITKHYKVNVGLLKSDLEAKGIVASRSELTEALGNPVIMVLPATSKGQNPVEILRNDPAAKHAASVIESYLTSRQYEVSVPEQMDQINALNEAQMDLGGQEEDYAYQLALSIGSDVYITYSGSVQSSGYGDKYAVEVRAFETTTGRLLGTETGYSRERKGDTMVSIEEALNEPIANVLNRINNYWKDDLSKGIQYKIVVAIDTGFDEDQIEEMQFAFMDAVDEMAKKSKENIVTNQTIDYVVWADASKYDKSSKVYRAIKSAFKDIGVDGNLKQVNINRKLILLKVVYE
ncbi:MAG: hypothetical protein JXR56_02155 [Candidatus Cloacimonetes bacterium]|nr:hypothetical protein [Candidatus Cloacimonadota bacterium]